MVRENLENHQASAFNMLSPAHGNLDMKSLDTALRYSL